MRLYTFINLLILVLFVAVITFLGSGADAALVGRGLRSAGGLVLSFGDNSFLVNPGPGVLASAHSCDVDLRKVLALLACSDDLYHVGGINPALAAMTYDGLDPRGIVLAPASALDGASSIVSASLRHAPERIVALENTPRVGINDVDISIVYHSGGVGYLFRDAKSSVGVVGLSKLSHDVFESFSSVDVLVVSLLSYAGVDDAHEQIAAAVGKSKLRALVLTDVVYEIHKRGVREFGRLLSGLVKFPVVMAEDGLIVDTSLYR